jgi:hypothetical protein
MLMNDRLGSKCEGLALSISCPLYPPLATACRIALGGYGWRDRRFYSQNRVRKSENRTHYGGAPTHRANDAPGLDTTHRERARHAQAIHTSNSYLKNRRLPPGSGAQPGKEFLTTRGMPRVASVAPVFSLSYIGAGPRRTASASARWGFPLDGAVLSLLVLPGRPASDQGSGTLATQRLLWRGFPVAN